MHSFERSILYFGISVLIFRFSSTSSAFNHFIIPHEIVSVEMTCVFIARSKVLELSFFFYTFIIYWDISVFHVDHVF